MTPSSSPLSHPTLNLFLPCQRPQSRPHREGRQDLIPRVEIEQKLAAQRHLLHLYIGAELPGNGGSEVWRGDKYRLSYPGFAGGV